MGYTHRSTGGSSIDTCMTTILSTFPNLCPPHIYVLSSVFICFPPEVIFRLVLSKIPAILTVGIIFMKRISPFYVYAKHSCASLPSPFLLFLCPHSGIFLFFVLLRPCGQEQLRVYLLFVFFLIRAKRVSN